MQLFCWFGAQRSKRTHQKVFFYFFISFGPERSAKILTRRSRAFYEWPVGSFTLWLFVTRFLNGDTASCLGSGRLPQCRRFGCVSRCASDTRTRLTKTEVYTHTHTGFCSLHDTQCVWRIYFILFLQVRFPSTPWLIFWWNASVNSSSAAHVRWKWSVVWSCNEPLQDEAEIFSQQKLLQMKEAGRCLCSAPLCTNT